ncbi:YdcF family protein [Polaromonas sp.]|uniref:YdcF family protein n=1 Tax=Polaromonas sp. TaxID=1869339 RepID=UPI002FC9C1F5
MELGALKPLLTSLVLPPGGPLLLALLGLLIALRRQRAGIPLALLSLTALWLLSCHGTAVWLSRNALPQFAPLPVAQLKASKVQAIVVLGGGVLPQAPEYGESQLSAPSAARLRYGLWLARQSGLPLAFSGGVGWAAGGSQALSEAEVAQRVARQEHGVALRWTENQSRDTSGNARLLAPLLQRDGIQRIALVTDASHMPRALAAFERTGLAVTPAPMGYILPVQSDLMEWLPSARGLLASRLLLHEWLGLAVGRIIPI